MRKTMSMKQIEANRRNAQLSTGPRTPRGKAVAKMNAVKHGILSTQVLVRGRHAKENRRELVALHERFVADLQPVGPVEEMLVDQVVTAHWRLRRALTAEAGEIALNVDRGVWLRADPNPDFARVCWRELSDPVPEMQKSALGNQMLRYWLQDVRQAVERNGELPEAAVQGFARQVGGKQTALTVGLQVILQRQGHNPDGLDAAALRARSRAEALAFLDLELGLVEQSEAKCRQHEVAQEESRQAAAVLPALPVLDKIMRYETKLERQLIRAMHELERVQRRRQGEDVPVPLTLEVAERP